MFGMGMGEIVLIAVVALLVLGPERLPGAAKAIGKGIRDLRMQTKDLQQTIEKDTQLGEAVRELRGALRGDPETLYQRATGQRLSDLLDPDSDKKKAEASAAGASTAGASDSTSAAAAEADASANPEADALSDSSGNRRSALAAAAGSSPDGTGDDAPDLGVADADSESDDSEPPLIRSAEGVVAREQQGGDDSSHG